MRHLHAFVFKTRTDPQLWGEREVIETYYCRCGAKLENVIRVDDDDNPLSVNEQIVYPDQETVATSD